MEILLLKLFLRLKLCLDRPFSNASFYHVFVAPFYAGPVLRRKEFIFLGLGKALSCVL